MIGVLFHNKKHLPLNLAVRMATIQYQEALHTRGHRPRQCRLNPAEVPEETVINGSSELVLTVYADETVRPHHIRVCADPQEVTQ